MYHGIVIPDLPGLTETLPRDDSSVVKSQWNASQATDYDEMDDSTVPGGDCDHVDRP
jgi:hypothetical protein